ncbi:MAG: FHA domain-containing protein [Verrucomicrobia bacterium]|nr:FHA domain-containing protein [Verrucomicrobiota bacterium]
MNCPNGHLSTSEDYCSVCGVKMTADPEPIATSEPDKSQSTVCPKCQTTQLDSNAQFCENCGHKLNEVVPKGAAQIQAPIAPMPAPSSPEADAPHASESTPSDPSTGDPPLSGWRVECRVFKDATLEESTPRGAYESSTEIVLKNPVTQIGRSSQKRNLHPEIACDWDDAVSHRHAKIELDSDGNAFLVDLGSTNGTMLNGQLISADSPVKLKDGDRISLGGKTALIIHGPRSANNK